MAGPERRFKQSITYALETGISSSGAPTLGAQTTAPARVEPSDRLMRDSRGSEFVATHVIYTLAPLTLKHRVWVPGEPTSNPNRSRRVMIAEPEVDGDGVERFRKAVLG